MVTYFTVIFFSVCKAEKRNKLIKKNIFKSQTAYLLIIKGKTSYLIQLQKICGDKQKPCRPNEDKQTSLGGHDKDWTDARNHICSVFGLTQSHSAQHKQSLITSLWRGVFQVGIKNMQSLNN